MVKNPVAFWCTCASSFRYIGGFAADYYVPAFFLANYPGSQSSFGFHSITTIAIGGFLSSLLGGIFSDKLGHKNPKNYSRICIFGSVIAWPFMTACTLVTNNFNICLACLAMRKLIGDNFWAANLAMMRESTPKGKYANVISAYQFFNFTAGAVSTVMVGSLVNLLKINPVKNPVGIGRIMALMTTIGYLGSILSWIRAGRSFKKYKES